MSRKKKSTPRPGRRDGVDLSTRGQKKEKKKKGEGGVARVTIHDRNQRKGPWGWMQKGGGKKVQQADPEKRGKIRRINRGSLTKGQWKRGKRLGGALGFFRELSSWKCATT